MRTYSELIKFPTFHERYEYLKLNGVVGDETFGWERHLNQEFYKSDEWKRIRRYVITRDRGCDLGLDGHDIMGLVIVHHMNPITSKDLMNRSLQILDPEYLISTTLGTHNAIHYGDEFLLYDMPIVREIGDTKLW